MQFLTEMPVKASQKWKILTLNDQQHCGKGEPGAPCEASAPGLGQ